MNSFQTALNAVLPMFLMLATGAALRRIGLADEKTLNRLNTLCFKVFLATNIYFNICKMDIASVLDARFLAYAALTQLGVLAVSLVSGFTFAKGKKACGAVAHCVFHTNFVIFGTLIGTSLCGEGNIGAIALLIAIIVPLQNVLSVALLELFRENSKLALGPTLKSVIKNPYVVAALLGFATQLIGFRWPGVFMGFFRDLGRCGTPLAMIAMGGLFNFGSVRGNLRMIVSGSLVRLLVVPAIFLPLSIALGYRGPQLVALMALFFAPTAATSFNLAGAMDSDADLTSQIIVFSSLASLLTIFGWIWLLGSLGLF